MKRVFLAILLITTIVGILGPASMAKAADPSPLTIIRCGTQDPTVSSNANSISQDGIGTLVGDALEHVLSGGSLRYRLLCDPLIVDQPGSSTERGRTSVYTQAKTLVNFGVLIILLVIAFANILQIKIDTYAVKKSIPLLIFGVIVSNLGLPIIRTIVDISSVLTVNFVHATSSDGTKTGFVHEIVSAVYQGGASTVGKALSSLDSEGPVGWGSAFALVGILGFSATALGPAATILFVGVLFLLLLPAIMFFLLGMLFIARIHVLVILAAISPVAFASLGFEPLRTRLWGWWWGQFFKWTFMAPATFALFWLGTRFFEAVGGKMDIGTYVITLFLIYYATQIPLKMGGSIMANWNKAIVGPLGKALYSPFTAAQAYIAKGGPRDISRFLSSKNLNPVRSFREGAAVIEAGNAKKEAESPAVKIGQYGGEVVQGLGLRRALNPRAVKAFGQDFDSILGKRLLMQETDKFLKEKVGLNDTDIASRKQFNDMSPSEQSSFELAVKKGRESGNTREIGAAYYANARAGINPVDHEEYLQPLRDQSVSKKSLESLKGMFTKEYLQRTGAPVYIPPEGESTAGKPADLKATEKIVGEFKTALAKTFGKPGEQERVLNLMLLQLYKATNTLDNVKAIEENPHYRGLATVIMEQFRNLSPQDQRTIGKSKLADMRGELGMLDPTDVLGRNLIERQEISKLIKGKWDNLRPILFANQAEEGNIRNLDQEQADAMIGVYANIDSTKKALERFVEDEVKKIASGNQAQAAEILAKLKPRLRADSSYTGVMPELIDKADLAGIDPNVAERVMNRLQVVQNIVGNLHHLDGQAGVRDWVKKQAQAAVDDKNKPPNTPP